MSYAVKKLDAPGCAKMRHALSEKQSIAIRSLLAGKLESAAAREAGVSRSQLGRWKNQPLFISELETKRAEIWADTRHSLQDLIRASIEEVGRSIREKDTATARWILERCGFEEIIKGEFIDMKATPVSIDDVLRERAHKEADATVARVKDPLDEFLYPPEKAAYDANWRDAFNKAHARLRAEHGADDAEDDGEQE